jgi:hypothetical protein
MVAATQTAENVSNISTIFASREAAFKEVTPWASDGPSGERSAVVFMQKA